MLIYKIVSVTVDGTLCSLLETTFASEGHTVIRAASFEEAFTLDKRSPAKLLLLDAPRTDGSARQRLRSLLTPSVCSRVAVVLDSGDQAGQSYFQSLGIRFFIQRPVLRRDLERLINALSSDGEMSHLRPAPASPAGSDGILMEELEGGRFFLAHSPRMREIYENIRVLAPVDVPVLILGESGVGKDIIANLLHRFSTRADERFVNVNCAAIPGELLESELFGYETGAFTGAVKAKPGMFEMADRGTILMDEIGEMSVPMQAKLLHVLQDGQFSRLGSRNSTRVNVRVLAATNINMEEAIIQKCFREDLFYRLNAFSITVPALRERREEIPYLLRQMFHRQALELDRPGIEPTEAMITAAQEYDWPGNLRELRNFVTRTLVLRDEVHAVDELRRKTNLSAQQMSNLVSSQLTYPAQQQNRGMSFAVREVKDQAESRMINDALHACNWNRRRAATNLHISYRSLLYKIQQYKLAPGGAHHISVH